VGELQEDLEAVIAVGVDVLPRFEAVADVEFVSGDARTLPFADASFDLTTIMTVLSSIPESASRRTVLAECLRVTRHGGTLLIYDFVLKNPLNKYTHPVSAKEIRESVRGAATVKVERVTLNPIIARLVFATRIPWARLICEHLSRVPFLCHHILVRAVKVAPA